jgi:Leucine-rich repeat (LRR) protein
MLDGESILVYLFNHELIKLTYLDLSSNILRYELVYALINLMNQCDLRCISFSSLIQSEEDGDEFAELFQINSFNLRELDFSNNRRKILTPVLQSLSFQFTQIEYLNLAGCYIQQALVANPLISPRMSATCASSSKNARP